MSTNKEPVKIMLIVIALMFLVSCSTSSKTQPTVTPLRIGIGQIASNNLNIRVDSVKIRETDGDSGLGGEIYFAILVTREFGGSAKLVSPATGTYKASVGDEISLKEFSLTVNSIKEEDGEKIIIHFLGFDSDDTNGRDEKLTNLALDTALEVAEIMIPGSSLVKLVLKNSSGLALDWWREEDILGEYSIVLSKENDWMRGEQYYAQSANGNLDIYFTILQSEDISTEPTEDVVLTIINNTSSKLEKLFVSSNKQNDWGDNWLKDKIPVNQSRNFSIPTGVYDLRIESDGLYWESQNVDLTKNKEWTLE